jgi:hypothetical protein
MAKSSSSPSVSSVPSVVDPVPSPYTAPEGVVFTSVNDTTNTAQDTAGNTWTFDTAKGWQKPA